MRHTQLSCRRELRRLSALFLLIALVAAGCSTSDDESQPPQLGVQGDDEQAAEKLGFPSTATRNTVRVGGGDPASDAAGVAGALYPATGDSDRPNGRGAGGPGRLGHGHRRRGSGRAPDRGSDPAHGRQGPPAGHRRRARAAEAEGLRPLERRAGDPHRPRHRAARRLQDRADRGRQPRSRQPRRSTASSRPPARTRRTTWCSTRPTGASSPCRPPPGPPARGMRCCP